MIETKYKLYNKSESISDPIPISDTIPSANPITHVEFSKTTALSELLKTTFSSYPLDHSFDKKQIKLFLDTVDPSVKDICKKIIDSTDHISFEKFIIILNNNIKELLTFVNKDRPIFIFMDAYSYSNYKTKSNYWIYTYLKIYIKYLTSFDFRFIIIDTVEHDQLIDNDIIIFIDDCIYSGQQMSSTIQGCLNKRKLKLNFYILVSFITNFGKQKLQITFNSYHLRKDYCKLTFPSNNYNIKSLGDVLNINEFNKFKEYYKYIMSAKSHHFLIYFDHKLADTVSTITPFYLGVIPNQNYNFTGNKIQTIIPIIKNCKHFTNKDDLDYSSPKCPAPPYKSSFKGFIVKYKKELKKHNYKPLSLSLSKKSKSLSKLRTSY